MDKTRIYRTTLSFFVLLIILLGLAILLLLAVFLGDIDSDAKKLKRIDALPISCTNDDECEMGICFHGQCICNNTLTFDCVVHTDCIFGTERSGTCHHGRCACYPNYFGIHCEYERRDISYCISDNDCNEGICIENEQSFGECWCLYNTTSNYCL